MCPRDSLLYLPLPLGVDLSLYPVSSFLKPVLCARQELREYEIFKPTPYFMKTYVPFFSMYAQVTYERERVSER